MLKLKLNNIKKTYRSGESVVALNGISVGFRKSEFVSVLGPSGCGKTTLLNIIGGLDRYDSGDLIINGMPTAKFAASDWDAYRNRSIGFVFQSYNLIGHQSVLQNVEIALTLSGVSPSERKQRVRQVLAEVGLSDKIKQKPNRLSGGQMQRVAIARALVNNPDIILADEPTGAIDTQTSVQIMDILKEISKTRLVIMVTHNSELAELYSDRIIRLIDGEIISDSNPPSPEEEKSGQATQTPKMKRTSMSLKTAASLSFKNLLTKRGRTITTAFAGSIGIIGVALVLALSNGLSAYIDSMQSDTLSGFPINISTSEQTRDFTEHRMANNDEETNTKYTGSDMIYRYDRTANQQRHTNNLTEDYLAYIEKIKAELPNSVNTISYQRDVTMNLLTKTGDSVIKFETSAGFASMAGMFGGNQTYWQEMPDNDEFILSLYNLIGEGSRLPADKNEIALVVDEYNRLDEAFFVKLGISSENNDYRMKDFIGKTIFKIIGNNDFYTKNGEIFTAASQSDYPALYDGDKGVSLAVVGILRIKEGAASSYLSQGFVYTTALTDYVVNEAKNSQIAQVQANSETDVLTGAPFANSTMKKSILLSLGADTTPTGISIYPVNFEVKDNIKEYLDAYNENKDDKDRILYTDMAETISSITSTLVKTVTYVLVGFAAISLLVSTIMIAIITYVSVIERTKEIGILRSVGARKKDISRVFNAEALIIGFAAGTIGVVISYILTLPINKIIFNLTEISGIASLNPLHALLLIAGSILLTLIAAFLPSGMAANKNPVEALRTE
ncbi:MAG: ABC transporter ATP-binding protein/permease [Eubacteriales bacterium]